MVRERRLRIFSIDPQAICDLLSGKVVVRVDGLPPDAEFVTAQSSIYTNSIQVLVSHPNFGEVPTGQEIPKLDSVVVEMTASSRDLLVELRSLLSTLREVMVIRGDCPLYFTVIRIFRLNRPVDR